MCNKRFLISISFLFLFVMSSCSFHLSFIEYDFSYHPSFNRTDINETNYYQKSNYDKISYLSNGSEKFIESYDDIYSSTTSGNFYKLSSTGDSRILVIPVSFSNSKKEDQDYKKIVLQNAFFGNENTNMFYSVSEYYYRSSYGQCILKGDVTDFYNCPLSYLEIESAYGSYTNASRKIVNEALNYVYTTYGSDYLKDFDLDNNGYIDALYLIYDAPKANNTKSLFWAFSDTVNNPNRSIPYLANIYSWVGFDFIINNNNINTHTLIHETGHLFGLLDYYNTLSNGTYQPTGYMDMMDYNVGDHSAFSKMMLNWVTPKVVTAEGLIELKPFSSTGDLILVPFNTYNDTPFDEYLLLEYYAPNEMNQKELAFSFEYTNANNETKKFKFLSYYGIKVYHVNARVGYFEKKGNKNPICFLDDINAEEKLSNYSSYCLDLVYDNSVTNESSPTLYHLLQKSGNNTFINSEPMKNEDLFIKGDSFNVSTFLNYKSSRNEEIGFSFVIEQFSTSRAVIRFNKI